MTNSLQRFYQAHQQHYQQALAEVKSGKKRTHWIWFIFPQLKGLGFSENSNYYGIRDIDEANNFLGDVLLAKNLIDITTALLEQPCRDAIAIFGEPDDKKLQSCMTLFSMAAEADPC
ncbi:MAG: DUF1810 family protein, partial [Chitinophagaceae bacterium]